MRLQSEQKVGSNKKPLSGLPAKAGTPREAVLYMFYTFARVYVNRKSEHLLRKRLFC